MTRISHAAFVAASVLLSGTVAHAEESGAVNLMIEGNDYVFPLWASQSDWSGSAQWASVNIYARPTDEETWAILKTFTLGLEVVSGNPTNIEASLMTADGDEFTKYYADEDATPLSVTIDEVVAEGEFLTVSGALSMTMGTSDNYGNDIDLSEPIEVNGDFVVTLGPVE